VLVAAVVAAIAAVSAGGAPGAAKLDVGLKHPSDTIERGTLPVELGVATSPSLRARGLRSTSSTATAAADPPLGTVRIMPVLDDEFGTYRLRPFTLRALGQHIEVWVQQGVVDGFLEGTTDFPAGDCRNDGDRNVVTDAQIAGLMSEFDNNIYPKESATFSVPPTRDGTNDAQLPGLIGFPDDYYAGDGNKIVTLISNVRDSNYYDLNNANGFSYIAGFFSSQINDFFDRNVMTIDVFDWRHRTGANPPDDPVPGDLCLSAPARPRLYEGVFAHEYQHLLENYEDPDELNWINEGISDWAQTLTGYVNPKIPITQTGFDSHTQCFLGWLGVQTQANPNPRAGGPENSLTTWGDQGDGEILCDYGAAYTAMEYFQGQFGTPFMTSLHRGDANGLAGLQESLDAQAQTVKRRGRHDDDDEEKKKLQARDVLHNWQVMVAVDGLLDSGASISGRKVKKKTLTTPTLNATINWDTNHAYDTAGAPPNGADYLRLRDATGAYLRGRSIKSILFQGAAQIPPKKLEWTVDPTPPGQTGDPAFYSGTGDNRDEFMVMPVSVPAGAGAVLTFDARWNLEEDIGGPWDFGYVQVSTNGGSTYSSLTCTDTRTDSNPGAIASVVENLPGFSGDSALVTGAVDGWNDETCSLDAYAGTNVLLAFRTINDPATQGTDPAIPAGFWVDDVTVGSTLLSDGTSTTGWKSSTETKPTSVEDFTVYLMSVRGNNNPRNQRITVRRVPLTSDFAIRGGDDDDDDDGVEDFIDERADFVAAIVIYDESTEAQFDYAPYRLTVNGVVQPGGGM
jgi:hypothetical protein